MESRADGSGFPKKGSPTTDKAAPVGPVTQGIAQRIARPVRAVPLQSTEYIAFSQMQGSDCEGLGYLTIPSARALRLSTQLLPCPTLEIPAFHLVQIGLQTRRLSACQPPALSCQPMFSSSICAPTASCAALLILQALVDPSAISGRVLNREEIGPLRNIAIC